MKLGKKYRVLTAFIGAGILFLLLALVRSVSRSPFQGSTVFVMGSAMNQTFAGDGDPVETEQQACDAVRDLESLISWRVEGSDINRLNESGLDGTEIDPRTWDVLQICQLVSRNSEGAFDPTVGSVSRLWDFDGEPHVPDEEALAAALSQVDYHALSLPVEYEATLAVGYSLDLGAVGKGAACDQVLKVWKDRGVDYGVTSVGGSVGLYGQKPWGEPWSVAVRDPAGEGSLGTLSLKKGCVSTSGSYEKTFTENGKTYHHLLDPKTGYPAESGLVSVTVWRGEEDGCDGAYTDALATACFVLGLQNSQPLLELFQAEALFITESREIYATKGLAEAFSLTEESYLWEGTP